MCCQLTVEGFRIDFRFSESVHQNGLVTTVAILFEKELPVSQINSTEFYFTLDEITRFMNYLKGHMDALVINPSHESTAFVSNELAFQIQALSGETWDATNGEFNISVMVNVGRSANGFNVYAGAEGLVDFESVTNFLSSLTSEIQ